MLSAHSTTWRPNVTDRIPVTNITRTTLPNAQSNVYTLLSTPSTSKQVRVRVGKDGEYACRLPQHFKVLFFFFDDNDLERQKTFGSIIPYHIRDSKKPPPFILKYCSCGRIPLAYKDSCQNGAHFRFLCNNM